MTGWIGGFGGEQSNQGGEGNSDLIDCGALLLPVLGRHSCRQGTSSLYLKILIFTNDGNRPVIVLRNWIYWESIVKIKFFRYRLLVPWRQEWPSTGSSRAPHPLRSEFPSPPWLLCSPPNPPIHPVILYPHYHRRQRVSWRRKGRHQETRGT